MCFNPLIGYQPHKGEKPLIFPAGTVSIDYFNGRYRALSSQSDPFYGRLITDLIKIPCGHCLECRLSYSRDWANRCLLESLYHDQSLFLTLTYSDVTAPVTHYCINDSGEAGDALTLNPKDVQDFFKRLRRYLDYHNYKSDIRYFLAGEYGDVTHRPHYHAIVFGLELPDLEFYKLSNLKNKYMTSEFLNDIWGKGFVVIGDMSWSSAAYVARYCLKKLNGDYKSFYDQFNLVPEFTRMSRRPGIGRQYFEDNKDRIFNETYINVQTPDGGIKVFPSQYYKRLFKDYNVDLYEQWKEKRIYVAETKKRVELLATDLDEMEYNAVKEANYIKRTKILMNRSVI